MKPTKTKDTNAEIAELQAKLRALEAKAAQDKADFYNGLGEKFNKLPEYLGLKDLEEVVSHIKAHQKGTLIALANGEKGSRASYTRLTDEQKAQIGVMLKAKRPAREIAEEMKCSVPTINKIKDSLGLTTKRNPLAAAK